MILFLLGISVAINVVFISISLFYIRFKIKSDFFNSDFIVDKDLAKEFLR